MTETSPHRAGPDPESRSPTAVRRPGGEEGPGESVASDRPVARSGRTPTVHLLPPTYRTMTPGQEAQAVDALAGLLSEAEQRRSGRPKRRRPVP